MSSLINSIFPRINNAENPASSHLDAENSLGRFANMLSTAKKVLKYVIKGLSFISFVIKSGIFKENFSSWIRSSKAIQSYIIIGGSLLLTYQNGEHLFHDPGRFIKSLYRQSKTIIDSYDALSTLSNLAQQPKSYLLPMSFALLMIMANSALD